MTSNDKFRLQEEIAREKSRLVRLEREEASLRAEIKNLERQLGDDEREVGETSRLTPDQKISLFRSLFRGRDDVFPRLWVNSKTGRKGYAPACHNEWVPGICEKPRVKCGECPNQAFIGVSDDVIREHLQGRHVIGVYPLLKDETCWFLAAQTASANWACTGRQDELGKRC